MSNIRAPRCSSEEWMSLISSCRRSGLSDAAWCEQNGISVSSFYNAVSRLCKKACQIPDPVMNSMYIHRVRIFIQHCSRLIRFRLLESIMTSSRS